MEVRNNPKMPAVGPGPGLGTKAIVPPCKAHRKSQIGINGALLPLDPQALSQAEDFGGTLVRRGHTRALHLFTGLQDFLHRH